MSAGQGLRFQEPAGAENGEDDEEPGGEKKKKKVKRKGTQFVHVQIVAADGEEPVEPGGKHDHSSGDEEQDEQSAKAFEEESRVARMSAASKKRSLRELRQQDLEAATVQLVLLAQKNTKVLPVGLPSETSKGSTDSFGSCCALVVRSLCAPKPASNKRSHGSRRKNAYESGFLWKLNSDVEIDLEDSAGPKMATLNNWRRRLFFVLEPREHLGDVAVVYISEKQNGQVHLVALLSFQGVSRSSVEELPAIAMSTPGRDTVFTSMSAAKQYDVALLAPGGLASDEDYEVPTELFPFAIAWQDAMGVEKRCVLAGATAEERQKWTLGIRTILARMKPPESSQSLQQISSRRISQ